MKSDPKKLKRVLIMAGGTGGHVFPGLAVAEHLRSQGVEVSWLGTEKGLEARLVKEAKFPLHVIEISGLRGKHFLSWLFAPFKIIMAIFQSLRIIRAIQPDVVMGMGGFVSGPGGISAWLLRRPLVIHEQNAKPGFTNKLLAHFSKRVLEGFPTTFPPKPNVVSVGNPVRAQLLSLPSPANRLHPPANRLRLLVLGGSLGAKALNEIVPKVLAQLPPMQRPDVWHQTGDKHFTLTTETYERMGVTAKIMPFIKEMDVAYGWADLVLCRAGALTIAELCAVGVGAIFVPFPHAVDDHQTANASFMVAHQAGLCIQQAALTENRLATLLQEFSNQTEKRLQFAMAAYQLRQSKVTERIFDILTTVTQ